MTSLSNPPKAKLSILLPLFLVIIVDSMGISLVYPILAPLFNLQVNGILPAHVTPIGRDIWYGLTMAIYPICLFFGAPILGDLSDQIGRKKVLLICLCGEALGLGVSGLAVTIRSLALLIFGRAFTGLMAANLSIAQAAIIDISDERSKTVNISIIGLANTLGFVLGPIISGYLTNQNLVSWFNFATPFYVAAVFALLNAKILIYTFKETFVVGKKKALQLMKGFIMFSAAFKNRAIRNLALVFLFNAVGWSFYIQFIALYLVQKYNFSSTQVGHFISWVALIMSIAMLVIIRIMLRFFKKEQIIYLAAVAAIITISLVAFYPAVIMQWLSVIILATGVGLTYACVMTLFSNAVDKHLQGWVMGVASSVMAAASGLAGLLVATVAPISFNFPFFFIALLWSASLLIFLFGRRKRKNLAS